MSRAALVAIALRAMPREMRSSVGEEMAATLLDSISSSRTGLVRELAGLLLSGARLRLRQTPGVTPRRVIADGFCLGAILVMTLDLSTLLSQRLDGLQDPLLSWTSVCVLGVTLATALVGAERPAGIAALGWTVARFPQLAADDHTFSGIAPTIVPLICFSVLALSPRRRRVDVRRIAWLLAPAVLVLAFAPRGGHGPIFVIVALGAILLMLVAMLKLRRDPRLAIACSLPALYVGFKVTGRPWPSLTLSAGAPAVMVVALLQARRRPQRT